ncbi:hypothetical protein, variant [Verruconis gallopava]|nr:hypothetical protein, variant [Verruconis gallopava]KIW04489.1 hypothetical protein, variant [Verruconis gallopava]
MPTLIQGFKHVNVFARKGERILVLGNDSAGKTTLLYRLKLNQPVQTVPTAGFNAETITYKKANYTFWDIGGCDNTQSIHHYISKDVSLLYVHNPIDGRINESLDRFRLVVETMVDVSARRLFIIFNKQDALPKDSASKILAEHRNKFERQVAPYMEQINCMIVDLPGFSALTGNRCFELFDTLHKAFHQATNNSKSIQTRDQPKDVSESIRVTDNGVGSVEIGFKEQSTHLHATQFCWAFSSTSLAERKHLYRLRVGYFLLLETLHSGLSIFECANMFLDDSRGLKETSPDRFHDTDHRTMTIFWLWQLLGATRKFKDDKHLDRWPDQGMFQEVLSTSPYLMNTGLWKEYYTKDLMMSPASRYYWRLPDLRALPDLMNGTKAHMAHERYSCQENQTRLLRFAFAVVGQYMSTDIRRDWFIKQTLATLQTITIRLRAHNSSIPAYSETHAYFWIRIVHAALASNDTSAKETSKEISVARMNFSRFSTLFDIKDTLWERFYTPMLWEAIEARMTFVSPDLQPLPDIITCPSMSPHPVSQKETDDVLMAVFEPEVPPAEELAVNSIVLIDEVRRMSDTQLASPAIVSHAHLLRFLFNRLVDFQNQHRSPIATASSLLTEMCGPYPKSLTIRAFWVQQALDICLHLKQRLTFEDFLRSNPHMVHPGLPECYFSKSLLCSLESRDYLVQPDLRKLNWLLQDVGPSTEDDWVLI